MASDYSCNHFSINLPMGEGQDDVPALLRHTADTIEDIGQIEPRHLIMDIEVTEDGLLPVITFYYDRPVLRVVD
jgi:hypothetical protein